MEARSRKAPATAAAQGPGRLEPETCELAPELVAEPFRPARLDVVAVEPVELLGVEGGGGPVHGSDFEELEELGAREDLLVSMRPAKPGEMVEHGLGEIAVVAETRDRYRPMALRKPLAVAAEDHGDVGVGGKLAPQGAEDVDLPGGVVDMVVTPDDVGHGHVQVVDHHGEVVGREAVRPHDDEVVELVVANDHPPPDEVVNDRLAVARGPEPDGGGLRARLRPVPAVSVVARLLAARELPGPEPLEPFLRAIAAVGPARREQRLDGRLVPLRAFALVPGTFVPVETEPLKSVENALDRLARRALPVRVLDAQDELPTVAPGVEPAEERGARASHVEKPGRARGESGTDGHREILPRNASPARAARTTRPRRADPLEGKSPTAYNSRPAGD